MAKLKIKNQSKPQDPKPLKVKVNKTPEPVVPKLRFSNLPDELKKPEPVPTDIGLKMKITNKNKPEKKLVIQFRKKNGQLQAKQADGKQWVKITNKQVAKLKGKVRVTGYDPYQEDLKRAAQAVAKQGPKGDPGEDGASVELRKANNFIQWKQEDEKKWKNLVSLNELQGEPGKDGVTTVIGGAGGGTDYTSLQSVVAGDNVTVDNTDPRNPIVSVIIPPDAGVMVIQAGDNIIVDSSVPSSPIIHAVMPSAYLLTGMFTNADALISGYKYAKPLTSFVPDVEQGETATVDTNPTPLQEFVSLPGKPGITLIVAGIASIHYDTQKASGTDNYYTYAEVYKRSRAGVETLLFTTDTSTVTSHNDRQSVTVTAFNANNIKLTVFDRIVVKIYGVMETGSADITVYYDGNTGSRLVYPTIMADSSVFVGWNDVLDEDNMASDSDEHVPTQQSVKAYVDSRYIDNLYDVEINTPITGHYLRYDVNHWINDNLHWAYITDKPTFAPVATGGEYNDLTDVTVAGIGDDYIMAWDADIGKWTPRSSAPSAGSIAWGAITGSISSQVDLVARFVQKSGTVTETVTGLKTFSQGIGVGANTWQFGSSGMLTANLIDMNNNPSGSGYISSWDSNVAMGSSDTSKTNNHTMVVWNKGVTLWQDPYTTLTGVQVGYFSGPGIFFVDSISTNFRRYGIIGNADGSSISGLAFGSYTNTGNSFTEQMRLTMDSVGAGNSRLDFMGITKLIRLVDPTSAQDAATKAYVDAQIAGAGGGVVEVIVEGDNIIVDNADPANPIVGTDPDSTFDTVTVDDEAYGAGWEDDLTVPTKNALFDVLGDIEAALDEILG